MEYMKSAHLNALDCKAIAGSVVRTVLGKQVIGQIDNDKFIYPSSGNGNTSASSISPKSMDLIRSLEWLQMMGMNTELVFYANCLIKRFLGLGELNSVDVLLSRIPDDIRGGEIDEILNDEEDEKHDCVTTQFKALISFKLLFSCVTDYMTWKEVFKGKPSGVREYRAWVRDVKGLSENFITHARDFMRQYKETLEESILREKYIPLLIFWMFEVLYETRDIIEGYFYFIVGDANYLGIWTSVLNW
jgi:hypothetical protein